MVAIISDKKEIDKIISDKIKGKKLVFTRYYELSIAQKGLTHEQVLNIFPQFDKVYEIEKETLKCGDIGYELFLSFKQ